MCRRWKQRGLAALPLLPRLGDKLHSDASAVHSSASFDPGASETSKRFLEQQNGALVVYYARTKDGLQRDIISKYSDPYISKLEDSDSIAYPVHRRQHRTRSESFLNIL